MTAGPYDAFLLLSFGGPEGPDDVLPFMENVTRGRGIPRERLVEVSAHYDLFGGVSPINGQNRALLAALEPELRSNGIDLPVYWGNRNWHPMLEDTVRRMRDDGVKRALCFATSLVGSYSGCRQYTDDLARATAAVEGAPVIEKLRRAWNHPGVIGTMIDRTSEAIASLDAPHRDGMHLAFCAHSIPTSMAEGGPYVEQLTAAASIVAGAAAPGVPWKLVFQSRSGPPTQPWLEPDVNDHLAALDAEGVHAVVLVPIGFISDHMEVVYDLDTQARQTADRLGMTMVRAATVGTDARFVAAIRELVQERIDQAAGRLPVRRAWQGTEPWPEGCRGPGCCPAPQRPPAGGNAPATRPS
jgi:protoporphyrin/coproporphyrin ferrochelatase